MEHWTGNIDVVCYSALSGRVFLAKISYYWRLVKCDEDCLSF